MPLCQARACGCSLISSSLIITGDGTAGNPWQIEGAAPQRMTESARAALSGGSLFDGLFVWTTDQDILWVYNGAAWERVGTGWITYTPVMANWALGGGASSLVGRYTIMRGMCYVVIVATFNGSSGTYTSSPTFTLPFSAVLLGSESFPDYFDGNIHASGSTIYSAHGRLSGGSNIVAPLAVSYNSPATNATYIQQHSPITNTVPFTWSTASAGSQIYLRGWYPIA